MLSDAFSKDLDNLVNLSLSVALTPEGFRNLVQIVSLIKGGDEFFRARKLELEGARLQNIHFNNLNLESVSFRGSDLTNVQFYKCILKNGKFEGSVLRETRFLEIDEDGLLRASFGDYEHFSSFFIDGRRIEDIEKLRSWMEKKTGRLVSDVATGPCPAARQLLFLFRKFIHVNGQGRRDILDKRGVLRGRQIPGAGSMEDCLKTAVDFGYFEEREHDRIRRATGPQYGEMVTYVKNQSLSSGLRSILDSLCRIPGCQHINRT